MAVSAGAVSPGALKEALVPAEQALARACPGRKVFRAFTSERLISGLLAHGGPEVDTVARAMARLETCGASSVAVQSLHIMPGLEYRRMLAQLEPFRRRVPFSIGEPLLSRKEDCAAAAKALLPWLPPLAEDEALVFVAHGAPGRELPFSSQLEAVWEAEGKRICLAALRGEPGLSRVLEKLRAWPKVRKVVLMPFMVAAGNHARQEMAGAGGIFRPGLEGLGYEARPVLRGLGQCPGICEIWGSHCKEAVRLLESPGKV